MMRKVRAVLVDDVFAPVDEENSRYQQLQAVWEWAMSPKDEPLAAHLSADMPDSTELMEFHLESLREAINLAYPDGIDFTGRLESEIAKLYLLKGRFEGPIHKFGLESQYLGILESTFQSMVLNYTLKLQLIRELESKLEGLPVFDPESKNAGALIERLSGLGLKQIIKQPVSRFLSKGLTIELSRKYERIDKKDSAMLDAVDKWVEINLSRHIKHLYSTEPFPAEIASLTRELWARVLINDLFHMVMSYPNSGPRLPALRDCMNTPELRALAIHTFQRECLANLLNNGASTVSIMKAYLQTISAMSVLDPRGVLTDAASGPIHRYLKERPDTVSIFVDGVMGASTSQLRFLADYINMKDPTDDEDGLRDPKWLPDPVDAPAHFVQRRTTDPISTLLTLYDNKEVFIRQLTAVVGTELLKEGSESVQRIRENAIALKRRFGDRHLQHIDVMLSDAALSANTNRRLRQARQIGQIPDPLIISKLYWPGTDGTDITLPAEMDTILAQYSYAFAQKEKDKQLTWLRGMGTVTISVALTDRTVDCSVTPQDLVVLDIFDEDRVPKLATTLTLGEIAQEVGLAESHVQASIASWMNLGIMGSFEGSRYGILETLEQAETAHGAQIDQVGSRVSEAGSDMDRFWSYINGMLTNLGAMPSEKIQSFLVMLVPKEDPYVKGKQELEQYLYSLVDADKLKVSSDGNFSLA